MMIIIITNNTITNNNNTQHSNKQIHMTHKAKDFKYADMVFTLAYAPELGVRPQYYYYYYYY